MAPVRVRVGDDGGDDDWDLPPGGEGGACVPLVPVSASASGFSAEDCGGRTISSAWKGSVVPWGRSWSKLSRARIRMVVFWAVRRAMFVEGVQRGIGRGRARDVSKPCFRARESSIQGLLLLLPST